MNSIGSSCLRNSMLRAPATTKKHSPPSGGLCFLPLWRRMCARDRSGYEADERSCVLASSGSSRFLAGSKARSLRCSSSPRKTRFAGLLRGARRSKAQDRRAFRPPRRREAITRRSLRQERSDLVPSGSSNPSPATISVHRL